MKARHVARIGGRQETIADERGFQFLRLVRSTCTVRGELPRCRPALRDDIIVNADDS